MDQIVAWLEKVGMSQYAERFAENGIGVAALRHLTDRDLKEIGVLIGHRRIMLAAIAELARGAERRQVTVMFSDLVGSTALAASMDPEDLREVISAYQNCVAETVRRFDGFVAQYMGDGVCHGLSARPASTFNPFLNRATASTIAERAAPQRRRRVRAPSTRRSRPSTSPLAAIEVGRGPTW